VPLRETTWGQPNSAPRVGELIISEIHNRPLDPDGEGSLRVRNFEFVEVFNTTEEAIDLTGWQLTGDVAFDFPDGTVIQPGQARLIVGFSPTDVTKSTVFQFTLGVTGNDPLLGPLFDPMNRRDTTGVLDDEEALVQLVRPGDPAADEPDGMIPAVVVDQVSYQSEAPWPGRPAGTGHSLTRTRPEDFGPLAISWKGAAPTPGAVHFFARVPGDADDDGQFGPEDLTQLGQSGKYISGAPAAWDEGDFNGDGQFDQLDLVLALRAGTFVSPPMSAQGGGLDARVVDLAFAARRLPGDAGITSEVDQ
jgi:hypothetical protein